MKVHLFYYQKNLYAFTDNITLAEQFMGQRSMNCFSYKKQKMDAHNYRKFLYENRENELLSNPLESVNGIVELVTTYSEDEQLSAFIDQLQKANEDAIRNLKHLPLKSDYKELLLQGLSKIDTWKDGGLELNLDTLSIFVDLFSFTFVSEKCEKE